MTVFHPVYAQRARCFDWTPDPKEALKTLIDLGVDRVLSSGQETTAVKGLETLKFLMNYGKDAISMLPGGGINVSNIVAFIEAGFHEVHGSFSKITKGYSHTLPMSQVQSINNGLGSVSDKERIKEALDKISLWRE